MTPPGLGRANLIKRIHSSAQLGQNSAQPWSKFFLCDELLPFLEQLAPKEPQGNDKCDYKMEHMEACDAAQLTWPLDRSTFPFCQHLRQQPLEIVFFCNSVWPFGASIGMYPDFIDANQAMKRLISKGQHSSNPWKKRIMPTLTGKGQYVVRIPRAKPTSSVPHCAAGSVEEQDRLGLRTVSFGGVFLQVRPGCSVIVVPPLTSRCFSVRPFDLSLRPSKEGVPDVDVAIRQVQGAELMAISGFHHTWYDPEDYVSQQLGTSFSGNAFSGFCVLPVLLALAATCHPDSAPAPRAILEEHLLMEGLVSSDTD